MQDIHFFFFIVTAAEGWGEKKICTKEVCDHQREGEGRKWTIEIYQLKIVILLGNSFGHRQSFWLVSLALPVNHKPNGFISLSLEKNDGRLCWNWIFLIFSLRATTPCSCKAWLFFSFEGGWGQGTAEHRLEAVFTCLSEHAVSHALLAGQKDALSRLSPINSLHPNISMHILHTVLYTFTKRLIRRICLTVKSCFS